MENISITKTFNSFHDCYSQLKGESLHGAIIIGASFLGSLLEQAIQKKLTKNNGTEKLLSSRGSLDFSKKIALSYALGLISKNDYKALNTIRDLRNSFAHQVNISLTNDDILAKLEELRTTTYLDWLDKDDPIDRDRIEDVILRLLIAIENTLPHITKIEKQVWA